MQISWGKSEIGTFLQAEIRPHIAAPISSVLTQSGNETVVVLSAACFNLT